MSKTENKLNRLLSLTLLILIIGFSFTSSIAQKSEKIISAGVINGKAKDLVKPVYPPTAKAVRVYGTIAVTVIINEKGEVVEAKAVSGHLFLRPSSITAALKSTFEPVKISGKAIKVSGVILYNYVPEYYNWLEIGYELNYYRFLEMLPSGFEQEKQLYQEYVNAYFDARLVKYQNLSDSIEEKLDKNIKNLWLFRVGKRLSEIQNRNIELKTLSKILKDLSLNHPQNVSKVLILQLERVIELLDNPQLNIYEPIKGTKLNQLLLEIKETMPILGI